MGEESGVSFYSTIDAVYGVTCLLCFAAGGTGNAIAWTYFTTKRKDNSTIIYITITLIDVLISILILPVGMSYLSGRRPLLFDYPGFCNAWHYVWQVLSRYSVALVGVLSITRTLSILLPLQVRISRQTIIGVLLGTAGLQMFTGSIMYWFGGRGEYRALFVDCSHIEIPAKYYYYHVIPMQLWYWLPVLPVTISCFISLYVLQKSKRLQKIHCHNSSTRRTGNDVARSTLLRSKDNATLTIVVLTLIYIVFNLPLCICNILWTLIDTAKLPETLFTFDDVGYYFNNLVYGMCVPLNALANPVVYFFRMRRLRRVIQGRVVGLWSRLINDPHRRVQYDQGSQTLEHNNFLLMVQRQNSKFINGSSRSEKSMCAVNGKVDEPAVKTKGIDSWPDSKGIVDC